jgi:hypothetical protein
VRLDREQAVETAAPAPAASWRAVVVLGAGRSGTSAITRGLQALGVELGDRLRPGGGKNPTGFFEDEDLLAINKRLKRTLGIRGDSVGLIDEAQWRTAAVETLQREAVATIRRRFAGHPLWGYKYGRTLRLLPFWHEVFRALDLDVRYVVALRNPLSVARSRARLEPRRGTQEKSDLEWLVNVVPYFRLVRERPFVVVDYDLVMADPAAQLERVAAALALPVSAERSAAIAAYAAGFLVPGLRHTHFTDDDLDRAPRVNELVRQAYAWLRGLATDDIDPHAPDSWARWKEIEHRVAALAPVLRHVDRVEAALRRAERHPFGPLQRLPRIWRRWRRG